MKHGLFSSRSARLFLVALTLISTALPSPAAELKLEAKLIWATNDAVSPDPGHTPVDAATAEKLRKVFKWKSYFIVNRVVKVVPSRGANSFELSKKCTVEIRELEGPRVEVKLIGQGKEVHKTTKPLTKGEWFVLAGDDKNESAWFVIITELDEK
jgi:hypothetical protein